MKIFTIAFLALFFTSLTLSSQVSRPVFTLKDEPGISHNARYNFRR